MKMCRRFNFNFNFFFDARNVTVHRAACTFEAHGEEGLIPGFFETEFKETRMENSLVPTSIILGVAAYVSNRARRQERGGLRKFNLRILRTDPQ